jgi:hypothetical protein
MDSDMATPVNATTLASAKEIKKAAESGICQEKPLLGSELAIVDEGAGQGMRTRKIRREIKIDGIGDLLSQKGIVFLCKETSSHTSLSCRSSRKNY